MPTFADSLYSPVLWENIGYDALFSKKDSKESSRERNVSRNWTAG